MDKQEVFERLNKIKIDLSNAAGASTSSAAEHVRAVVAPVHDLVKLIEDMVGAEDDAEVSATAPREELTEPKPEPTVSEHLPNPAASTGETAPGSGDGLPIIKFTTEEFMQKVEECAATGADRALDAMENAGPAPVEPVPAEEGEAK